MSYPTYLPGLADRAESAKQLKPLAACRRDAALSHLMDDVELELEWQSSVCQEAHIERAVMGHWRGRSRSDWPTVWCEVVEEEGRPDQLAAGSQSDASRQRTHSLAA